MPLFVRSTLSMCIASDTRRSSQNRTFNFKKMRASSICGESLFGLGVEIFSHDSKVFLQWHLTPKFRISLCRGLLIFQFFLKLNVRFWDERLVSEAIHMLRVERTKSGMKEHESHFPTPDLSDDEEEYADDSD